MHIINHAGSVKPRKTKEAIMNFYQPHSQFYCGIDLHSRNIYICVIDREQKKRVHCNLKNRNTELFLKHIEPYKQDLVVGCESSYAWYWLADLCADNNIEFILLRRIPRGFRQRRICLWHDAAGMKTWRIILRSHTSMNFSRGA